MTFGELLVGQPTGMGDDKGFNKESREQLLLGTRLINARRRDEFCRESGYSIRRWRESVIRVDLRLEESRPEKGIIKITMHMLLEQVHSPRAS